MTTSLNEYEHIVAKTVILSKEVALNEGLALIEYCFLHNTATPPPLPAYGTCKNLYPFCTKLLVTTPSCSSKRSHVSASHFTHIQLKEQNAYVVLSLTNLNE